MVNSSRFVKGNPSVIEFYLDGVPQRVLDFPHFLLKCTYSLYKTPSILLFEACESSYLPILGVALEANVEQGVCKYLISERLCREQNTRRKGQVKLHAIKMY